MENIFSLGQSGTRGKYLFLMAISIVALINDTAASYSVCCATNRRTGEVVCAAFHKSCAEIGNPPLNGFYCKDLGFLIARNPPHPITLIRESGGKAYFIIEGQRTQISSDELESFIMKLSATKAVAGPAVDKEYETILQKDRGVVSDRRLNEISKDLGIPITGIGSENADQAFGTITIELIDKDGRSINKATTDKNLSFNFARIPDGAYTVKISGQNGKSPKSATMRFSGISTIVCCCPGPPCEPLKWLLIGNNPSFKGNGVNIAKATLYTGTLIEIR